MVEISEGGAMETLSSTINNMNHRADRAIVGAARK